jgi:hypothetical protein
MECVLEKFYLLLMEIIIDSIIMALVASNLDQLYDVQMMFGLASLFPMLVVVHSLIKFAELLDVFMCDVNVAVCLCNANLF